MTLKPDANEAISNRFGDGKLEFFREAEQNFLSNSLIRKTYADLGMQEVGPEFVNLTKNVLLKFSKDSAYRSNLYSGSYLADSGSFAVQFLEKHLRNYLDTEIEKGLRIVLAEQAFFRRELEAARERVEASEHDLLAFKASNTDALPGTSQVAYKDLIELRERKRSLDAQIAEQELTLKMERAKLGRVSPFVVLDRTENNPYQAQIATIEAQLAAERASGKGPKHPDVVKLEESLTSIRRLASGESGNTTSSVRSSKNPIYLTAEANVFQLESSLAVARQERERITEMLKDAEQKVTLLPKQESNFDELDREYKVAKQDYDVILSKLKEAEQQVELERAASEARYDMITPPQVEYVDEATAMKKHATKFAALVTILGFVGLTAYLIYRRKLTLDMLKPSKAAVPASA
ncbi:MAG: hypothetical protein HC923_12760 [Myxococcales bacterium]|nr:hypothetical protein [Myxococcales bacterium]